MIDYLISVIVPIYNMEKYLPNCIESILKQSYRNLEIVLVNDGSTDSCREICEFYHKKDTRIRVLNKENGGLSSARNYGINNSHGEWFAFVDSDDWIEPRMIEELLEMAISANATIAACRYYRDYKNITISKDYDESKRILLCGRQKIAKGYLMDRCLSPIVMNKLYRRDIFVNGFTFPEGRNYEDIPLMTEIIRRGERIIFTGKHFYHYRQRNNSIIHSKSIKNAIDNWISREERYRNLKDYLSNEYNNILVCECITAIYKMWCLLFYYRDRKMYKSSIADMRAFSREHYNSVIKGASCIL